MTRRDWLWHALALAVIGGVAWALPGTAAAQRWAPTGPNLPLVIGQGAGGNSYSVPIQTLLFFTALSFCRPCCC